MSTDKQKQAHPRNSLDNLSQPKPILPCGAGIQPVTKTRKRAAAAFTKTHKRVAAELKPILQIEPNSPVGHCDSIISQGSFNDCGARFSEGPEDGQPAAVAFTKTRERAAADLTPMSPCGAGCQPAAVAFTKTRKRVAPELKPILQIEPNSPLEPCSQAPLSNVS